VSDVMRTTVAAGGAALVAVLVVAAGCGGSEAQPVDASAPDAQSDVAAAPVDAGAVDAGAGDGASQDSGGPVSDAAAEDAAAPPDATADGPGGSAYDGGACNNLVNSAPLITIKEVAADPSPPQGGTIADGTYWLTDLSIYTGPNGPWGPVGSARTTWQIAGGVVQIATNMGLPPTYTLEVVASGSSLEINQLCPPYSPQTVSFTATTSTFIMYVDTNAPGNGGPATWVWTFTKQ
jgi:hypothetical protein